MYRLITFGIATVVALALPAGAGAQAAAAQASVDARWLPWIGCWRPTDQRSPEEGVHICVVPEGANGARITTLAGDRVVLEETIVPDGATRPVDEPTCRGSRRSEWSTDGQRVYSSAELACDKQAPRKVSGLSALTANAEWIDIQVVMYGTQENVRVRRYQRSSDQPPDPASIPAELAARVARSGLGTRLSVSQIVEASGKVAPRVLEALLFETKPNFPLDSRQLIALDEAGVSDTVIDLMVAFSFPKRFEVKRSVGGASALGGFGWGGFGWSDFVGAEQAFPWYYDPYYSFFSPFGYGSRGYWDGGGYYYGAGTGVIANGEGGSQPERHGRVVNGSGYTQVVTRTPENAGPATQRVRGNDGLSTGDASSASSGGSSGGSSGVSSGGYSSGGGGGDSGRTAIPR